MNQKGWDEGGGVKKLNEPERLGWGCGWVREDEEVK